MITCAHCNKPIQSTGTSGVKGPVHIGCFYEQQSELIRSAPIKTMINIESKILYERAIRFIRGKDNTHDYYDRQGRKPDAADMVAFKEAETAELKTRLSEMTEERNELYRRIHDKNVSEGKT